VDGIIPTLIGFIAGAVVGGLIAAAVFRSKRDLDE
jgi:outer membrane lipoprotein SlyB